jgi:hypothetical protein
LNPQGQRSRTPSQNASATLAEGEEFHGSHLEEIRICHEGAEELPIARQLFSHEAHDERR